MANKPSKPKDLYAAIDHLVIDSPAFADLSGSAVRLLLIITRQFNGRNNGNLQATFSYCKPRGIGSENTLKKAVAELISHGFIYRTRSHGFDAGKNIYSRYAITWRKITDNTKGLFAHGFKYRAWQKWPFYENTDPQKVHDATLRKCSFIPLHPAESAGCRPSKSADYELLAINKRFSDVSRYDSLTVEIRKQAVANRPTTSGLFYRQTSRPIVVTWRNHA